MQISIVTLVGAVHDLMAETLTEAPPELRQKIAERARARHERRWGKDD